MRNNNNDNNNNKEAERNEDSKENKNGEGNSLDVPYEMNNNINMFNGEKDSCSLLNHINEGSGSLSAIHNAENGSTEGINNNGNSFKHLIKQIKEEGKF